MANVAFLVPYPEMCDLVWSELGEGTGHITPVCVEYVPTPQVRGRVRELEIGRDPEWEFDVLESF